MEAASRLPAQEKLLVIQLVDKVLIASKLQALKESITSPEELAQELKNEEAEYHWLQTQAAYEEDEEAKTPGAATGIQEASKTR